MSMRRNWNEETTFKRGVGGCDGSLFGWVRHYISRGNKEESILSDDFGNGYFTVITEWDGYQIVYANDTKVKYLIFDSGMYRFGITPLYNADGTLQIYEESED